MTRFQTSCAKECVDLVEVTIHDCFPDALVYVEEDVHRWRKDACEKKELEPLILDFGITWITDVEPFIQAWFRDGLIGLVKLL